MRWMKYVFNGILVMSLLAAAAYSVAGLQLVLPPRSPVVLGEDDVSPQRWISADYAGRVVPVSHTGGREGSLKIVSYNVHKCRGLDFRRDPERVARVILELDADIIALQEVLSEQVAYIAERTGMYMAVAGPTIQGLTGDYGNALLSRFPIGEVRLHDISLGEFEPRGVIDADVFVEGQVVRVFVTHFGLFPSERRQQLERLIKILPVDAGSPVVVLGDLNEWFPWSPNLRKLKAKFGGPAGLRSFPSVFPLMPLDRAWVIPAESLQEVKVHRSFLARISSDHLPVIATISLPRKKQDPFRWAYHGEAPLMPKWY
jgi:endonuclease/exonuclease/phosphatase family metal-dependent hydrolase